MTFFRWVLEVNLLKKSLQKKMKMILLHLQVDEIRTLTMRMTPMTFDDHVGHLH